MPKTPACQFRRCVAVAILFTSSAALARPPDAEPDNLLNDRFTLQAGFIQTSNQTGIRLDSSAGTPGTGINAENDLGLPDHKLTGLGEIMFRMRERHRIRVATYFLPLDRRATTVLARTLDFGDTTYNVNDTVASQLQVRLLSVNYTYSFVRTERVEFGASLGFDVISFDAMATIPARLRTEDDSRSGPAPLAGLDGTVRISSRFYAEARAQYLKVDLSNASGTFKAFDASVLYRLNPNVTFGIGYAGYDVSVDWVTSANSGSFGLRSIGPQAFARIGF
ncbi:MAG TPA: hypothetical protein VN790_00340 [Steroidobacteraceae bacterium]|nr:hypothetical protein [Steroidobacteraceae bacterium]